MPGSTSGQRVEYGVVRSALMLIACIFAVALVLMPVAVRQSGTGNPLGLASAAAICLASGLAAECLGFVLTRTWSPLAGQLSGMSIRMLLPLFACLILALQGFSGRENLAFVCYLLAFYIVTLALETWLAVKRVAGPTETLHRSAS
jgi:hypothetical protein